MCPSETPGPSGPGGSIPGGGSNSSPDPDATRAGAVLTIDLDALAENYQRLRAALNGVPCAAVVKADGYGLGLTRVAPALFRAGARIFFVAQLGEAIALRGALPEIAEIYVLNGLAAGPAAEVQAPRVLPVLLLGSSLGFGLGDLEEGVLRQLLLDTLRQIQGGQLQDLHRLDHLRRLDESLLEAGGLVESELQRSVVAGLWR